MIKRALVVIRPRTTLSTYSCSSDDACNRVCAEMLSDTEDSNARFSFFTTRYSLNAFAYKLYADVNFRKRKNSKIRVIVFPIADAHYEIDRKRTPLACYTFSLLISEHVLK